MTRYRIATLIAASFICCLIAAFTNSPGVTQDLITVKAPFQMPPIVVPNYSKCDSFVVTSFGAKKGDQQRTTAAIARAIKKANASGGGVVVIPPGEWLTGKIHLKSNVNLHLLKGAVLLFSGNPADYLPAVVSSWEGMECMNYSPLIYAYQCKNVSVSGQGEIYPGECTGLYSKLEGRMFFLHLSEQYFTSSHTFSHFLRQLKGRPQTTQIFCGRSCFLGFRDIVIFPIS